MMPASLYRVPFVIVHHANQYLITNGYPDREGIDQLVAAYEQVMELHQRYSVPANLHLSGTLLESVIWHAPRFLERLKRLMDAGLLDLSGGCYSEGIMSLFPPHFNMRQLEECLFLYQTHLGVDPREIKVCWVPERVWQPQTMCPVLTSESLSNGGYSHVLLDDRLLYPVSGNYPGSAREFFDSTCTYFKTASHLNGNRSVRPGWTRFLPEATRVYSLKGSDKLNSIPISSFLRYSIPPATRAQWRCLNQAVSKLNTRGGENNVLVYADDMEKTGGVGPWDPANMRNYEAFLVWMTQNRIIEPVLLSAWLLRIDRVGQREVEMGTYFELAHGWQAGEDYHGWWEDPAWIPYRQYIERTLDSLSAADGEGLDRPLMDLAWKHFQAATYETAWHWEAPGGLESAPWARALSSHSRASLVILAAARWFAASERPATNMLLDIDGDGMNEVVMANQNTYAVISPECGGRLVYLFALTEQGGRLMVGNPSDDWNWQEDLNKFMEQPSNHPGAFADDGHENDRYRISDMNSGSLGARVDLVNIEEDSDLLGSRKSFHLNGSHAALSLCYQLTDKQSGFGTEVCLSPNYYLLLRRGRSSLSAVSSRDSRGFKNGEDYVWLTCLSDEECRWLEPAKPEAGHGLNLRVEVSQRHFHLMLSLGRAAPGRRRQLALEAREAFHQTTDQGAPS